MTTKIRDRHATKNTSHLGGQSGASPATSLMCPPLVAARLLPMITIESLTKRYGRFTAVDDVTFTASPGRVTGFLGPNGAGKSTTMRVMVGLTPPTAGEVTINGRRYADLPNPGFEVGVLLDASAQHAGRTGREILTIAQRTMGLPKLRVEEMLDRVSPVSYTHLTLPTI